MIKVFVSYDLSSCILCEGFESLCICKRWLLLAFWLFTACSLETAVFYACGWRSVLLESWISVEDSLKYQTWRPCWSFMQSGDIWWNLCSKLKKRLSSLFWTEGRRWVFASLGNRRRLLDVPADAPDLSSVWKLTRVQLVAEHLETRRIQITSLKTCTQAATTRLKTSGSENVDESEMIWCDQPVIRMRGFSFTWLLCLIDSHWRLCHMVGSWLVGKLIYGVVGWLIIWLVWLAHESFCFLCWWLVSQSAVCIGH